MKNESFVEFCKRYWYSNISESETTKCYRLDKAQCIQCYVLPFFGDITIDNITTDLINQFFSKLTKQETREYRRAKLKQQEYLRNKYLSIGSIKLIRTAVLQPLQYFQNNIVKGIKIHWNSECPVPAKRNKKGYFKGMVAPRDIFTSKELDTLCHSVWKDERAHMMFLLSRYTGMRNGELRGLRIKSIKPDYIDIQNGYNSTDGLKSTKNGNSRKFPIFKELYQKLKMYISLLPSEKMQRPDSFVFPSFSKEGVPVGACFASYMLNEQMKKLRIPKERSDGGIIVTRTFHSLRHCMDTYLTCNTKMGLTSISHLMGHSPQMVQHYSDHFNSEMYNDAVCQIAGSSLWPKQYRADSVSGGQNMAETILKELSTLRTQVELLASCKNT